MRRKSYLFLTWCAFLLAPLAWAASLNVMFPLTRLVCGSASAHAPILWVSATCAALGILGTLIGWRNLHRANTVSDETSGARFLLRMSLGMSPIFLLVIVMMTVPVFLLAACPR